MRSRAPRPALSLRALLPLALTISVACIQTDATDLDSVAIDQIDATLTVVPVAKFNFQPASAPIPAGYTAETGLAFSTTRGFGWVRQDSLSSTHVPVDIAANTRDRNRAGIEQRLDTLIHMQLNTAAAWEHVLPSATYRVTVSAGDQPTYNSQHTIRVEGVTAINRFQGTTAVEYRQATVDVVVSDGRLTVDAIGGTNTKINYLEISRLDADGSAALSLENRDEIPFPDRLVTSKLSDLAQSQVTHSKSTLRIHSTGTSTLTITGLTVTGGFRLNPTRTFPINVAAGSSTDVTIEITAGISKVVSGNLAIASNAAGAAVTNVQLAGSSTAPEGGNEPTLPQVVQVFGYQTTIVASGQLLANKGHVEAVGDELLAPYWRVREPSQPVVVHHIAAYHGRSSKATFAWHDQGSSATNLLISTGATNAQTLLPRREGSTTLAAKGSFTSDGIFGFKSDDEWSDPTRNDHSADVSKGCQQPCGHHMRFWPAKDRSGVTIPGTYVIGIDIKGINYDYQDNVYLVSNVTPADATPVIPPPPGGVTASGGNGQATVRWNPSPGAISYTVKMSTSDTGPFGVVQAGIPGTTFTVTGLPNGIPHFFVVSATGTGGDSADSMPPAQATPSAGADITNLVVNDTGLGNDGIANNTQWSVRSNLAVGDVAFGDRTFTIAAVANSALLTRRWIRTAADSKSYAPTSPPLATFTLVGGTTVYLAIDNRHNAAGGRPAWLTDPGFTDEGSDIVVRQSSTSTFPYSVWKKTVAAGSTVTLPTINSSAAPGYLVIVE